MFDFQMRQEEKNCSVFWVIWVSAQKSLLKYNKEKIQLSIVLASNINSLMTAINIFLSYLNLLNGLIWNQYFQSISKLNSKRVGVFYIYSITKTTNVKQKLKYVPKLSPKIGSVEKRV